jgi:chromate reductase
MNVLGISGSLRQGSYNTAALRAAMELAPVGMTITQADISDLPLYNDDVRAAGYPDVVQRFRREIQEADALLIVTPEYNYSVSGVLKNAIDWASRPPSAPLVGKPVAIMGASNGMFGTARAQYHLRQICLACDMHVINRPEVMIGQAAQKFDASGRLTDEKTREFVGKLLVSLATWTTQLAKP